jgi:single-strand DNA-binding protein
LELWDGQAKIAEQYLKKGMQLYVEGKIKSDSWQDEQGNNRKRIKIRVLSFTMLGGKPEGSSPSGNTGNYNAASSGPSPSVAEATVEDDDLPF